MKNDLDNLNYAYIAVEIPHIIQYNLEYHGNETSC